MQNRDRKRRLMEIDPEAPGFFRLLNGEGDMSMQRIAWLAVFLFAFCALLFVFSL